MSRVPICMSMCQSASTCISSSPPSILIHLILILLHLPLATMRQQYSGLQNANSEIFDVLRSLKLTNNAAFGEERQNLHEIVELIVNNKNFKKKYCIRSLFPIACGAFGYVFRLVTKARGCGENVEYPDIYIKQLQSLLKANRRTKKSLLNACRNDDYLDIVAVKFEKVQPDDVAENSAAKLNLLREYLILRELFSQTESRYSMIGFPLPIEFGFLGDKPLAQNLKNVKIVNLLGIHDNYENAFTHQLEEFELTGHDITDKCYMAMELTGPSLQEWGEYYREVTGYSGEISFTVRTTLKLMDQVLCRLIVMHRKGYLHLDLKPDNICMGLGKMCNTIYLLDYGLSKKCSNNPQEFTVGSPRYMSLGVIDFLAGNFMMDIESWFYLLTLFLCGYLPWTEEAVKETLRQEEQSCTEDKVETMSLKFKREFWSNDVNNKSLTSVRKAIEEKRSAEVEDIDNIYMQIYSHVKTMLKEFYKINHEKMTVDIRDEESALFKRYMRLRKLLLYIYSVDTRGGIFEDDKEFVKMQRGRKQPKLVYAINGRDWQWDWDL